MPCDEEMIPKTTGNTFRILLGDRNGVSPAATPAYHSGSSRPCGKAKPRLGCGTAAASGSAGRDPDCPAKPNPTANFTALRDEPHEGLFFDQPLEIGGQRGRRIDVARQEGTLTELEIAALARQVRRSTREAYYAATYARAESERLARVVEVAKRLDRIAEDRFKAGDVAKLEVIQTGLEVSRAEADLQVARQREKVSMSRLNALLNESASKAWDLAGALEDNAPTAGFEDLISRAYQSNPDLQHLGGEKKVEESHRSLLKAERIPDLDLEAGMDFNSPRDFRYGPRSQVSIGLPLFARNQGEIAQSLGERACFGGRNRSHGALRFRPRGSGLLRSRSPTHASSTLSRPAAPRGPSTREYGGGKLQGRKDQHLDGNRGPAGRAERGESVIFRASSNCRTFTPAWKKRWEERWIKCLSIQHCRAERAFGSDDPARARPCITRVLKLPLPGAAEDLL